MPPTATTKTLSPAELAKLEHAFATDPASEAYRPLAEAYLGMGRFMEAMVVCKKGVKAHPTVADPRVLLARVYADQGKEKKALEELAGALTVAPNDKFALRLAGSLQVKTGEADVGKANLLKAFAIDPADAETQELLKQHKVEPPVAAAPPPPPPAPVVAAAAVNGAVNGAPAHAPQTGGAAARGAPRPSAARPAGQPQPRRPVSRDDDDEPISELSDVSSTRGRKSGGGSPKVFFALVLLAPVAIAAYFGYGKWHANQIAQVNASLRAAAADLRHDSYASYKSSIEKANNALDVNPTLAFKAHGILAYAYAVRWGEHGGNDEDRKGAEEHVAAGLKGKDEAALLYAGDALVYFYEGNAPKALETVKAHMESLGERNRSSLLYLTQGIIQMNMGDLDAARDSLDTAQQMSGDDSRVYVAQGTLARRRGLDSEALIKFDTAKRYEQGHADALLGTAAIVLDQPNPDNGYVNVAGNLKKLLEGTPPPSPRQLAMAHALRALLITRVAMDLPLYTDAAFQKTLEDGTGVGKDKDKAKAAALKEEEQAMSLDSKNPELFLIRGKRLLWEKNPDGAATEIRKAISINDSRPHYYIELARALLIKEGGDKDAEDALRKALAKVPNNPRLQTLLGQVLLKQKRPDEAIAQFEAATKNARTKDSRNRNPEAFFALGKLYRDEKKDLPKAMENFEYAAIQSVSDVPFASRAWDEHAQTAELKGDKQVARISYDRAVHVDEYNDDALCRFARLLIKGADVKDKDQIRDLAGKYLKAAPKGECVAELKPLAPQQ